MSPEALVLLRKQLTIDEGRNTTVYQDHLGYWTIGVGRLVDGRMPGAGLRKNEIDLMLDNDIADRIEQLNYRLPWFSTLDDVRQAVLINMAFQLGIEGLMGFVRTLDLVHRGLYAEAADAMMQSRWARQTPGRATRLADLMANG